MKKGATLLKIENPCQQDWDSMETAAGGRFCQHCSHIVIDFTSLSDSQVLAVIEKSNGKLCGRFRESQLNRLMVQAEGVNSNPRLYKILAGLLLLATANNAISKPPNDNNRVMTQSPAPDTGSPYQVGKLAYVPVKTRASNDSISGSVIDGNTKKPLAHATVHLKNSKRTWMLDATGKFAIIWPEGNLPNTIIFQISAPGYETLEFAVDKNKLPYKNEFALLKQESIMMGDMIQYPEH